MCGSLARLRIFAPLRPIKWFIKSHNSVAALAAFHFLELLLVLSLSDVIICHPETTDDVCFSPSCTIRDEVVRLGSLSLSLELCVGQRDSRGGNRSKDREEDTVICRRKTHMLLALKDVMADCMDTLSREQSTLHNLFPCLALPVQVF